MKREASKADNSGVRNEESGDSSDPEALIASGLGFGKPQSEETEPEKPESAEAEETEEPSEETVETETEEQEGTEETEETAEEETEGEETEDDVLSQIDVDSLTEEQKAQLAEAIGSGAGKEIGKLRSKNKELQKELEAAKEKIEKSLSNISPSDNPYRGISSEEEFAKAVQTDWVTKDYLLDTVLNKEVEEDDYGKRGYTLSDGNFYEKDVVGAEIKRLEQKLGKANDYKRTLERKSKVSDTRKKAMEKVEAYEWYSDEESAQRKNYDKLLSDPEVKLIEDIAPNFGAKLPEIIAAYVSGGTKKPLTGLKIPLKKAKPNATVSSGASSQKPNPNKNIQKIRDRVNSGQRTEEDLLNLIAHSVNSK